MAGADLTDTDLAARAQLDEEECRILLGVLQEIGAIERRGRHLFMCRLPAIAISRLLVPACRSEGY